MKVSILKTLMSGYEHYFVIAALQIYQLLSSVKTKTRNTNLSKIHMIGDNDTKQCCGSDFSMSSGSGSYFQKVSLSEPTFFLTKYDFKGPKIAFQSIIFKEYLNLLYKNGQNY
jgi:hypothetical protein